MEQPSIPGCMDDKETPQQLLSERRASKPENKWTRDQ